MEWVLIIGMVHMDGLAIVPHNFPTQEACIAAVLQSRAVNRYGEVYGDGAHGVCVPIKLAKDIKNG